MKRSKKAFKPEKKHVLLLKRLDNGDVVKTDPKLKSLCIDGKHQEVVNPDTFRDLHKAELVYCKNRWSLLGKRYGISVKGREVVKKAKDDEVRNAIPRGRGRRPARKRRGKST